jgi:hypothetical protein
MKNINKALRKKFFDLLNGAIIISSNAVPVYNKYLPSTVTAPSYIVLRTINNNDTSNFTRNKSNTSLQIGVYTKDTSANDESFCDTIVEQILAIVYPSPSSKIDLMPYFQACCMKLDNDFSPDALQFNNAIYINRFLTFSFQVMHQPVI